MIQGKHLPGPHPLEVQMRAAADRAYGPDMRSVHSTFANGYYARAAEDADLIRVAQQILRGYGVKFEDAALRGLLVDAVAKATGGSHV